jgi:hypothetical protein
MVLRCISAVFPRVRLRVFVERRPLAADMSVFPRKSLFGKEHGAVLFVYRELTGNFFDFSPNLIILEPF